MHKEDGLTKRMETDRPAMKIRKSPGSIGCEKQEGQSLCSHYPTIHYSLQFQISKISNSPAIISFLLEEGNAAPLKTTALELRNTG